MKTQLWMYEREPPFQQEKKESTFKKLFNIDERFAYNSSAVLQVG